MPARSRVNLKRGEITVATYQLDESYTTAQYGFGGAHPQVNHLWPSKLAYQTPKLQSTPSEVIWYVNIHRVCIIY